MQICLIDEFSDFLKLEKEWNQLLKRSQSDCPFLSFEWLSCWWESHASGRKLFVLLVKERDEVIALAPLMIERVMFRGLPARKLCFIADGNSLSVDFILTQDKEECLKRILEFVRERRNLWDLLALENIGAESDTLKILSSLSGGGSLLYGFKPGSGSPCIDMNSDWESFFSGRPKKFREVTRNKQNRLRKLGEIAFEKYERLAPDLLPTLFDIGVKSWKNKKKKAISSTKERRNFFEHLSEQASQKGWLLVWLLKLSQKPIAFEYHLKYNNKVWGLRSEFDEDYRDSGPGTVLDRYIMEQLFKDGFKRYHLGWGVDFYKLRWTENIQIHQTVLVFPPSLYGRILYALEFKLIHKIKLLLSKRR